MPIHRAGSKQLKEIRQLRSSRGTFVLSALLGLTLLWTFFSVQKVIARHRPLPSQLRAQTQAKQLSDHLAASELHLAIDHEVHVLACNLCICQFAAHGSTGSQACRHLLHASACSCRSGLSPRADLERHRWRHGSGMHASSLICTKRASMAVSHTVITCPAQSQMHQKSTPLSQKAHASACPPRAHAQPLP